MRLRGNRRRGLAAAVFGCAMRAGNGNLGTVTRHGEDIEGPIARPAPVIEARFLSWLNSSFIKLATL
jgi:hypothetical protein